MVGSGSGKTETEQYDRTITTPAPSFTILRANSSRITSAIATSLDRLVRRASLRFLTDETPDPEWTSHDIAAVAVAALTDDRRISQLYELTGPRAADVARAGR